MAEEMVQTYEGRIAALEKGRVELKEEFEGMLLESEDQFKEQDSQYEAERFKVEKLRNEIAQITSQSARQQELRQVEMKLIEENLKAAKLQSEIKEADLIAKVLELREEREKVTDLEATVKVLEMSSNRTEMEAAVVVEGLNLKLDEGIARYAKMEEERNMIVSESRNAMNKLQDEILSLETEFTDLKGEIVSKDSKLEQRQATIDSLMNIKEALENKILSYRSDLETLMTAYDETKEEYSNAVKSMKAQKEKDSSTFLNDYEQLQALAIETQEELEKHVANNMGVKHTADERKRMIDDLVNCNKDLAQDKAEKDSVISNLQEKCQAQLTDFEEIKRRSAQFRIEKEKEVNAHLDALERERTIREELEHRVQTLENKLEETKKQVKSTAELKASNFLLQDKIDRQEAYLKRKLHKDKVMKERMIPANPSIATANPVKSPSRPSSTRSLSVTRANPITSPPRPSSARSRSETRQSLDGPRPPQLSRSSSRSSSVGPLELQRSVSDELDELLE